PTSPHGNSSLSSFVLSRWIPQRREHDFAQQKRKSCRAAVHFGFSGWLRASWLCSQSLVRGGERGGNGQQHRGARVTVPFWNHVLSAWCSIVAIRSVGALCAAER